MKFVCISIPILIIFGACGKEKYSQRQVENSSEDYAVSLAGEETLSFTPVADGYVRENFPNKKYGSLTKLWGGDSNRDDVLMKFNVSDLDGRVIQRIRLRVRKLGGGGGDATVFNCNSANDWTNDSLDYKSAPGRQGAIVSTNFSSNTVYEVDLTTAKKGAGTYCFRVGFAYPIRKYVSLASSESSYKPELLIDVSSGDSEKEIAPDLDGYVRQEKPTSKYGSASKLWAGANGKDDLVFRFNLSGGEKVSKAVLSLYKISGSQLNGSIYTCDPNADYSENNLSYANAPEVVSKIRDLSGMSENNQYYNIDISSHLSQNSGTLCLRLKANIAKYIAFNSKEGNGYKPKLTLTIGSDAPQPPVGLFYVDKNHPNASDGNSGTEQSPWKTIQKAAATLKAGETVYIKEGIYTGTVNVQNSGQTNRFISFEAFPGHEHKAVMRRGTFEIRGKSYIRVSGLKIQDVLYRDSEKSVGFLVRGPSHHIRISGNYFRNTHGSAISAWGVPWKQNPGNFRNITDLIIEDNFIANAVNGGHNEQITVANGVYSFIIRNNTLTEGNGNTSGGEGIDVKEGCRKGKIYGNHLYDLTKNGIYIDAGRGPDHYTVSCNDGTKNCAKTGDIDIYNNLVHDFHLGGGITIVTEGKHSLDNIRVFNNIVYNMPRNGFSLYKHPEGSGTAHHIHFINNTAYANGWESGHSGGGFNIDWRQATGVIVRNNIAWQNSNFNLRNNGNNNIVIDHNLFGTDPKFINANAANFKVRSDSLAIDAGSGNLAPEFDFENLGRPRGGAPDIGAYEK